MYKEHYVCTHGIVIDKGYIKSVHQPIKDYFPERNAVMNDRKQPITIEYLLMMASGQDWMAVSE